MNTIRINPFEADKSYCIGFQTDNEETTIIFEGIQRTLSEKIYLKIQLNDREYVPIPITDNQWLVTSTWTAIARYYTCQLVTQSGKRIANTECFKIYIKESVGGKEGQKETIDPALIEIYDNMIATTKKIEEAYQKGELNGANGLDGLSAYQIAVKNGFEGTEKEWLESLHGSGTGGTSNYELLKNKPSINNIELSGNLTTEQLGINIPTKVSELANDSGYLTQHQDISNLALKSEVPKVPAWSLKAQKPTYTAEEVGALPSTTKVPTKTSELTNDSQFIDKETADGLYEVKGTTKPLEKLTFTGASTGTYDGTKPLTIDIPTGGSGGGAGGDEPWVELYNDTINVGSPVRNIQVDFNNQIDYKEYDILAQFSQNELPDVAVGSITVNINQLNVGYFTPSFSGYGLDKGSGTIMWEIHTDEPYPYFDFMTLINLNYIYQQIPMKRQYNVWKRPSIKGLEMKFSAEYQGTVKLSVYGRGVDNE